MLARLLPDFATRRRDRSRGALRSLHEPELIAAKHAAAELVLRHAARRRGAGSS